MQSTAAEKSGTRFALSGRSVSSTFWMQGGIVFALAGIIGMVCLPWTLRHSLARQQQRLAQYLTKIEVARRDLAQHALTDPQDLRVLAQWKRTQGDTQFAGDLEQRVQDLHLQQFQLRFPNTVEATMGTPSSAPGATPSLAGHPARPFLSMASRMGVLNDQTNTKQATTSPAGWATRPWECQLVGSYRDLARLLERLTDTTATPALAHLSVERVPLASKPDGNTLSILLKGTLYLPEVRP